MMRIILLFFCFTILACNGSSKKTPTEIQQSTTKQFRFKVLGLHDDAIADSISNLIFRLHAIEQILLTKTDSSVSIVVQAGEIDSTELASAIEMTGGQIILW